MQSGYPTPQDLYEASEKGEIQPFFDITNNRVTIAQLVLEECLRIAARSSQLAVAKLLLNDFSVNKNATDDAGKSAINYASGETMEYLNFDQALSQEFLKAVDDRNLESIRSFLPNELVDVNAFNGNGDAFYRCCDQNLPEILRELLAHPRANPNGNPCSWTPLKTAIANGFQECVDLLLAFPSINKRINKYGIEGNVKIPDGVFVEKI